MNLISRHPRKFLSAFTTLLLLYFLLQFHHFIIVYVNSSFLGQFVSPEWVSLMYTISSLFVIGVLIVIPRLISYVGAFPLFILSIPALQLVVFFLGFSTTIWAAATFFVMQAVLLFIIRYLLDLYLESLSKDETKTGNTRSLFLTAGNIGVFLGPLAASLVIIGSEFSPVYALAALLLTPLFIVALGPLRNIKPNPPKEHNFLEALKKLSRCRPNIRRVMAVSFIFYLFGAMIVIYAPLYLFEVGMLSWQAIGSLTAIAMLPYLILEIPLGFIADKFTGEKEFMIAGLVIMGVATALLSFTPLSLFLLWSLWFFVIRIGGAMVDIATESYFFKQVNEEDASLISAFRIMWPLGAVIGPLIALAVLPLVGLKYLFAVFGAIFLLGIPFAARIIDTR